MTKTYTFYTDPGHGWLCAPLQEVRKSKISVSRYSYMRDGNAFLEEDCDAPKFLQYLQNNDIQYKIVENNTNNESPIRSYKRFV